MVKELSELEDIPNIEEPSPIEKFDIDDYFDLVIENIQNKYQIRQFKENTEEIRKLAEKLEEAERNMGQKDIQIATITRDNIAELDKLNDTLEQEKAQFIKFKQDHEREKPEEIRKLTEKLEEAEHKIRQNKHRIATLTNEKAKLNDTLQEEKTKFKKDRERYLKENKKEIRKLTEKLEENETNIRQKDVQIATLTRDNIAALAKLNDSLEHEKAQFVKFQQDHERQFKERKEEIRQLTEKLEEAERNLGQKDIQIATLTRDNIAKLAKLNDTLEHEKSQFIKLKQDHEREKTEEIGKLTQKLEEAEHNIRQNKHLIATLTNEKAVEIAKFNDTLHKEKIKFTKLEKDQESALKEKEEEIRKLKDGIEKAKQCKLICQAEMPSIERSKQMAKDKEQLEKDSARIEKENIDRKAKLKTEHNR